MSEENELPKGWVRASLDAVGALHCGQSPSVSEVNHDGDGTPYVTGPDQWDGSTLTVDKWTTNAKRVVPNGCVFVTVKGAGVGTLFPGVACAIGRDVYAFEPSPELSTKFIVHSLRYNILEVLRHAKGDIPGLSKGHILGHVTAFPPRNEQDRIVAKIDELFSDLDAGVAALERARANLKRYRAAVLKAAVEGKLTEQWRAEHPATEPASKLLDRIMVGRRKKWEVDQLAKYAAAGKTPPTGWQAEYGEPAESDATGIATLPMGWRWASIGQCFAVRVGATPSRREASYWGGDIPWVSSGQVQFCRIREPAEYITQQGFENSSTRINPAGSVLLGMIGEGRTRGQAAILDIDACNNQNCAAIWVSETPMPPEYVFYWLWSQYDMTRRAGSGNNQPALNRSRVERLPLALPPLVEQREIVAEVERLLSVVAATEGQIEADLRRAVRLRQSILKRAFEGKLVAQDPADEPASALLERIRGQRASSGNAKGDKIKSRGRR